MIRSSLVSFGWGSLSPVPMWGFWDRGCHVYTDWKSSEANLLSWAVQNKSNLIKISKSVRHTLQKYLLFWLVCHVCVKIVLNLDEKQCDLSRIGNLSFISAITNVNKTKINSQLQYTTFQSFIIENCGYCSFSIEKYCTEFCYNTFYTRETN